MPGVAESSAVFVYRADPAVWPFVFFDSPGARAPSLIDQESFYVTLEWALAHGGRFATLHDLRETAPDAKRRQRFTQWVNDRFELLSERMIAHAVVLDGEIQRRILTAVLWFTRSPCPMKVFTDRARAEAWLAEQVDAAGVARR
jgi:hypothetical protein